MTHENDAERGRRREETDFAERLRELHAPEPMPPARRAAFLRELGARLEGRPRRRARIAAVLVPAAALLVAWLYLGGSPTSPWDDEETEGAAADALWAYEVLNPPELSDTEFSEDFNMLPDDYLEIGSEFLDS